MNRQQDRIDKIFERARSSEPKLDHAAFVNGVMQQIAQSEKTVARTLQIESILLWAAGLAGAVLAASLFPVDDFLQLLNAFSGGTTFQKTGIVTLISSAVAYSAYWIVETDSI